MVKIRISEGHGQGRKYNRGGLLFNEGDQNFIMAGGLIDYLNANYEVDVKGIRHERGNFDHSLYDRARYGDGADLFYSWHSNAGGGTGVEVILSYQSLSFYKFAKRLAKTISGVLEINNRGVKFRNYSGGGWEGYNQANHNKYNFYAELRNTAHCAMMVEHCFHDNSYDSRQYLKKKDELIKAIGDLIAREFALIRKKKKIKPTITKTPDYVYTVQIGAYKDRSNAVEVKKRLKEKRFDTEIEYDDGLYRVYVGQYTNKKKAELAAGKLRYENYKTYIKKVKPKDDRKTDYEVAQDVLSGKYGNNPERKRRLEAEGRDYEIIQGIVNRLLAGKEKDKIKVGDKVRVKNGARSYEGKSLASFVYTNAYRVDQLDRKRAVLDKNGICTAVNTDDLIRI